MEEDRIGKWGERLQFTLLFLVLTVMLHVLFGWFHGWLKTRDPYREPEGRAVKVIGTGETAEAADSPGNRLRLFYWYGE